ncbi:MAG: hypothetical protein M2R45_05351 [Verrucomicrobia subdivision 3 bacterium]|nr:hypothetical protein [Limisphaerales bacterium]MCS1416634.1 hypothetical protein [Limisphaerales bacterium]
MDDFANKVGSVASGARPPLEAPIRSSSIILSLMSFKLRIKLGQGIEKLDLEDKPPCVIMHSTLGCSGPLCAHLMNQLRKHPELEAQITALLNLESTSFIQAAELLVCCAFGRNTTRVVLCDMNRPQHINEIASIGRKPPLRVATLEEVWGKRIESSLIQPTDLSSRCNEIPRSIKLSVDRIAF